MSDHLNELREIAREVFENHQSPDSVERPALDSELWQTLNDMGFIGLAADDSLGGSGGELLDAATVLGELGTARIPYAEAAFIAVPALDAAGVPLPERPFTAALASVERSGAGLTAEVGGVPFARDCGVLVLLEEGNEPALHLIDLGADGVGIEPGANLCGEPRDTVTLRAVAPIVSALMNASDVELWRLRGALARAVASAGVANRVVDRTLRYVSEREQFGRPLLRFQVVQHAVATMAEHATAMQIAAQSGAQEFNRHGAAAALAVAAAKAETAALSGPLAAAAHQAHGAIGFTEEHALGSLTARLWAWREEHGNEHHWYEVVGDLATGRPIWQLLTDRSAQ